MSDGFLLWFACLGLTLVQSITPSPAFYLDTVTMNHVITISASARGSYFPLRPDFRVWDGLAMLPATYVSSTSIHVQAASTPSAGIFSPAYYVGSCKVTLDSGGASITVKGLRGTSRLLFRSS